MPKPKKPYKYEYDSKHATRKQRPIYNFNFDEFYS